MLNDRTMDRYLHAILLLGTRFLVVRAVDVASWLEYSKASVSVAVKQMLDERLVSIGNHGALLLTADGERRASAFHERYEFFNRMLTEAGIDEDVARKEAGALAGCLSNPSLCAIKRRLALRESGRGQGAREKPSYQ